MISIAVFISGNGTDLQSIINAQKKIIKHGYVSFVLSSSPFAYGVVRAKKHNIDVLCLNEQELGEELFYYSLERRLKEHAVDLIVLAGYIPKLSESFTIRWDRKIINIHPSLLPKYGGKGFYGLRIHQAVLDNGDKFTGATIHYVDKEFDAGEIIAQQSIQVCASSAEELQYQVQSNVEWILLPKTIEKICQEMEQLNKDRINVAVIGSGGREHALVRKILKSNMVRNVVCIPGNAGMIEAKRIDIPINAHKKIIDVLLDEKIGLCIIGPELPLAEGLAERIRQAGILCFGPNKSAAKIETSKAFAKEFMAKYHIPTASYRVFNNYDDAERYVISSRFPVVIKADGLCAGKGVFVCQSIDEALASLKSLMVDMVFGNSGKTVVVEEYLSGIELSLMVLTDGHEYILLPSALDYKKAFDGNCGPNTGSMGAISPHPKWSKFIENECVENIVKPTIEALQNEGIEYFGCIYFGLILTEDGVKVLEYNCRFGDPETEAVFPLVSEDIVPLLVACSSKKLRKRDLMISNEHCCAVVLASIGYPNDYITGTTISNVINDSTICCSVQENNGVFMTSGGRVACSIGLAESREAAQENAYKNIKNISAQCLFCRNDIGN